MENSGISNADKNYQRPNGKTINDDENNTIKQLQYKINEKSKTEQNEFDRSQDESLIQEYKETVNIQNVIEQNEESYESLNGNNSLSNNKEEENNKTTKTRTISGSVKYRNSNDFCETDLITESRTVARFSPKWKQFTSAFGAIIMIFAFGLSSGYSATLLPHLKEEESVILSSPNAASWIASVAVLPMAPCCFIGGWLMETIGRRQTLRSLSIPFFIGWIIIACASNFTQMIMGRFINGASIGLVNPCMSVFISESTSPELRGMFLAFLSFSFAFGIFISHLIGTWISWQWTAIISSIFPLISATLLLFVPESPVWLLSKGKINEGIKSFYWLRGHGDKAKDELKAMIEKFKCTETLPIGESRTWRENLEKYVSPAFFKPLFITITLYLTCHYSGVHTITFYSVDIIEKSVGGGIDRYVAMLTIDALRVITTLITFLTSRNCPRRTLCMISGILTTLSMLGLSVFLYFHKDNIPAHLTAVPLCFLSAFIIAVNIGLMPLPLIIVGEIFPANVRSFGAGIASAVGYASIFIVVKTAPGMMLDFGQVITFSFYGTVALVGTGILFLILPETRGKSLLEIESIFKRKRLSTP